MKAIKGFFSNILSRKFFCFLSVMGCLLYGINQGLDGKWFVIGLVVDVWIYMSANVIEKITIKDIIEICRTGKGACATDKVGEI